ncbi:MAG: hypothetical protein ABI151_12655 [Chitinophagaceae bacterium]
MSLLFLFGWICRSLCLLSAGLCMVSVANGQVTVSGTVWDLSKTRAVDGVSVMSTSGQGTVTNDLGKYIIVVGEKDSIYFSYLTKPTMKFPVSTIQNLRGFDVSLHVQTTILPEVRVMPPNYKYDSTQNRLDYAKAFNFRKPGLGITSGPAGGAGVGLDLDQLINVFRFRKNKSMLGFQKRLVQEEEDKFVDHRFTKLLVRRLTGLKGDELNRFMRIFRPNYEFTKLTNDYDFQYYIKKCYMQYKAVFTGGNTED